ncbi:hypothetical protein PCL_10149 [Purpureocillium lilacinum]|uniref:Uncharacterized protein n=2 Tax=Purpureocillium lilacinum TaxID=33203 RepID=A0A2U3EF42_PURLI|nr:hypothetical protein Purlil1_1289 [Purpureocillium lilacinum]PWI73134.1 hypothetical protein PCL_10149 [Purpureocillium lilacinum]
MYNVIGLVAPMDNYEVFIPQWDVEVFPGQPAITLNGTLEEVRSELNRLNPNWDSAYVQGAFSSPDTSGPNTDDNALGKRTDFYNAHVICGGGSHGWRSARYSAIMKGIDYLRGVPGRPGNSAGPGSCGRDRAPKLLNSFGSIADGANYIVGSCTRTPGQFGYVVGQVFHHTNWNVIVREDSC